jgi:hypothetical protein
VRPAARKLLGSSSNVIQVAYSNIYPNTSAICPSSAGGVWDPISGFGHLVSDNWVCSNPARPAKVSLTALRRDAHTMRHQQCVYSMYLCVPMCQYLCVRWTQECSGIS